MSDNLGMRVRVRFRADSIHNGAIETFRNVTEVHYLYPCVLRGERRIAFESGVHGTGSTYSVVDIAEMEIFPDTERARAF